MDSSDSATNNDSKGTNSDPIEYDQVGNSTAQKAGIIEHKKGMDKKDSTEKKKEEHRVSSPGSTSNGFQSVTLSPSSPNSHLTPSKTNPHLRDLIFLCLM